MTTQRPTAATPIPIPDDAYDLIIFDRVNLVHPDTAEEYALARTERKDGQMSLRRGFFLEKGEKVLIEEDAKKAEKRKQEGYDDDAKLWVGWNKEF